MKNIIIIILLFLGTKIYTQEQTNNDSIFIANLLKVPSSPAFYLLNADNSNVDRPANPTDFLVKLSDATQNFSLIPKNYCIEFSPGWIWWGDKFHYNDIKKNNISSNIAQTLALSFAIVNEKNTNDSIEKTHLGLGFKMSLLRGKINGTFDSTNKKLKYLIDALKKINDVVQQKTDSVQTIDPEYRKLKVQNDIIIDQMENAKKNNDINLLSDLSKQKDQIDTLKRVVTKKLQQSLMNVIASETKAEMKLLKDSVSTIPFDRHGFNLDLSGGLALDFRDQKFTNSKIFKGGIWLSGGYTGDSSKISLLGVLRLLNYPDSLKQDTSSSIFRYSIMDIGARFIIDKINRFSISAEAVVRKLLYKAQWNIYYSIIMSYELFKNKVISFSLGKNFAGVTTRGGNLIAAINLLLGFGSARPIL